MPGNFSSVIRQFLGSPKFAGLAQGTQVLYRHQLTLAEAVMGHLPVETVRPAIVQGYLDGLSVFPGKQSNAKTALKAVEKWAIVRDLLPHPITIGTQTIPLDGGHEPWSEEQIDTAIAHARPDLARVILLAANTGQRGSDIVKMRWSDIEEEEGRQWLQVTQKKTGRQLSIPLSRDMASEISKWEKRAPFFLVLAPDGRQYTRDRLSHDWTLERDGNPHLSAHKERGLVLHGLRAAAVVRMRREGFTEMEISNLIGMSEPMVHRYSRLANRKKMNLASIERIENLRGEKIKSLQAKLLKSNDPTI